MLEPARLLEILKERGIVLRADAQGTPRLSGPKGAVTPALRRVLAWHRDAVLALHGPLLPVEPAPTPAAAAAPVPASREAWDDPLPGVTLEEALCLLASGISVLPIALDGTKRPVEPWKRLQARLATREEAQGWWGGERPYGIAAVCGHVSCGLEMIDFDLEADAVFPAWLSLVKESIPGIGERLAVMRTPAGKHCWFRWGGPVPGNQVLASVSPEEAVAEKEAAAREGRKPKLRLVETRGEGGYALVPGGPLAVHSSGRPYLPEYGSCHIAALRGIDADDRDFLLDAARSFDRGGRRPPDPQPALRPRDPPREGSVLPGEDYERRGDWSALLRAHGWTLACERGGVGYWARPGKTDGHSATLGHCHGQGGKALLKVFTSGDGALREGRAYSLFGAYAALECGGDCREAAKKLRAEGYGT